MNTVRDIRLVLAEEVRRLQAPAGLEARVLQEALHSSTSVAPAKRVERRVFGSWDSRIVEMPPLMALVAVLLTVAIVVSLVFAARALKPLRPVPATGPSPAPLVRPLNVDPALPAILFFDPGIINHGQIDGLTWDGQVSGKVYQLPPGVFGGAGESNPEGTLFITVPDVRNRSGRVVATLPVNPDPRGGGFPGFGVWADDGTNYCETVPDFASPGSSEPATLQVTALGGAPRNVSQIGRTSDSVNAVLVVACSVMGDRAVVIQAAPTAPYAILQYWVVQLSSGRVLWTRDLPATAPPTRQSSGGSSVAIFASHDARYVAEVQPNGATTIYGPSGSAVAHLADRVRGFSWDDSLVVVGAASCTVVNPQGCPYGGQASLVRWLDGTVVWRGPTGQSLAGFEPQPGGTNVAIETLDTTQRGDGLGYYPTVVYVVSADGHLLVEQKVADSAGTSWLGAGFL